MALVPHIYKDAGLTQQFDDAVDSLGASALQGGEGDGVFYVGDPDDAKKIENATNAGVDQITVTPVDSAPGTGVEASHIKLALTQGGLAGATGGAALNIGSTINGGVVNAVAVWYRWANSTGSGTYTDITLDLPERVESAV